MEPDHAALLQIMIGMLVFVATGLAIYVKIAIGWIAKASKEQSEIALKEARAASLAMTTLITSDHVHRKEFDAIAEELTVVRERQAVVIAQLADVRDSVKTIVDRIDNRRQIQHETNN